MKKIIALTLGLCLFTGTALADKYYSYKRVYEVSITNITKGQTFTPQLVADAQWQTTLIYCWRSSK